MTSVPGVAPSPDEAGQEAVSSVGEQRRPTVALRSRGWPDPAAVIVAAALVLAVVGGVLILADYRNVFVHPEWHFRVLPGTLREGLDIGLRDVVVAMRPQGASESRPRWLVYLISGIDQKLRLRLYDWLPIYPTFAPLAWLLQIVVTPVLLYRLVRLLTASHLAAMAGLAIFVSSAGFLSGLTMLFLPGKVLGNTLLLAAYYATAVAAQRLRPGQLLIHAHGLSMYALLGVLFVGLFIDELAILSFIMVPCFFWRQFVPPWPWTRHLGQLVGTWLLLAVPGLAFLAFVVFVAPPILAAEFNFTTFDYLGELLMTSANQPPGASLAIYLAPSTLTYIGQNLASLVGLPFVPWFISPLIERRAGEYPVAQVMNLPKIALLVVFVGLWLAAIVRTRGALRGYLIALAVIVPLFILLLTLILIRHIPQATGYYYGSGFACLFALLVALLFRAALPHRTTVRTLAAVAVVWVVIVQFANFLPINAGWLVTHNGSFNDFMMRAQVQEQVRQATPLIDTLVLSSDEVQAVWSAWKRRELEPYVREHGVSRAAAYLVYELRQIERLRPQPGATRAAPP